MDDLLNRLKNVLGEAIEVVSLIRFNRDNPQHLYMVCLHGTVLEMANGCLSLYKTKNSTAVPVLLRAQLEAYVDLRNLSDSVDYLKFMNVAYLHEKKKMLGNAIERGKHNAYLETLANCEGLRANYYKVRAEIAESRGKGFKKLEVWERFEKAGLTDLYDAVYPVLCQHSHNNLNILEKRHLMEVDGTVKVSYFQTVEKEENLLFFVDTIAGVLADSTGQVFSVLGIDSERLSKLKTRLEELRALY